MISYKIVVLWALPYAIISILGAFSMQTTNLDNDNFSKFTYNAGSPSLYITETQDNPNFVQNAFNKVVGTIKAPFTALNMGFDTLGNFVDMATLDYPFFQEHPILQFIRYLLLAGTVPLVFLLTLEMTKIISNFMPG
ncbi:MAG: hypothetical protein CMM83_04240 [Rhodospirillales bacterium]|nr:hypothetical protein [Rhodospirillales bacterium]|tara:strand:- start:4468 stop:4878 length:411 start_codon:yes stop_codon:yes gene_type:complete